MTADTPVATILAVLPESRELLAEYGLHCVGCSMSGVENIGDGCRGHGWSAEETTDLLDDLNALLKSRTAKPMTLTLTLPAAKAIKLIATQEGKSAGGLRVTVDEHGGFCLEFDDHADPGDLTFAHPDESGVRIIATPLILHRIGGATIDAKDGRLKLDVGDDGGCGCGQTMAGCGCS